MPKPGAANDSGTDRDGAAAVGGLTLAVVLSRLAIVYGSDTIAGMGLFVAFAGVYWVSLDWAVDAITGGAST